MKKTLLIIVAIIVVIAIAVGAYLLVSTSTTKVKFEGNQCLAIGFIAKGKEERKNIAGDLDFKEFRNYESSKMSYLLAATCYDKIGYKNYYINEVESITDKNNNIIYQKSKYIRDEKILEDFRLC